MEDLSKLPEVVKVALEAVKAIAEIFGVTGTLVLVALVVAVLVGRRLYHDRRADRDTDRAMKEMERTIQRMAQELREHRIALFKERYKWTDEQVERFMLRGDFENGPAARRALEGEQAPQSRAQRQRRRRP